MTDDLLGPPRRRQKKHHWGRVIGALAVVVVLVAVVAGIVGWELFFAPTSDVEPGIAVTIVVPEGSNTRQIAEQLAQAGVVSSASRFRLEAREANADGKLRAGTYELATGMPNDLVIERLLAGEAEKFVKVTIPEGWRITQIAKRLEKQAGIPAEEFRELAENGADEFAAEHPYLKGAYGDSLEGFLFPKTYDFPEGVSAREAIEIMLDQFDREVEQVDVAGAKQRGLSLAEVVNAASIIERETRLAKERELVSSVIHNRLDRGMRLQMCSTVVYVLNKNELRLTTAETKTDSPYNTYLHEGLPPGPIASPGLASLQAAASPADTDYLYYVLTGKDGSHTFASNDSDFLRAKSKSKEVFGE